MQRETEDDALTLISVGVLAFTIADVTHEALGHGVGGIGTCPDCEYCVGRTRSG